MHKIKKRLSRRRIQNLRIEKEISLKNKNLIIDKILSYSPDIAAGIEKYIDAHKNFWLLLILAILLINFPIIALPCSILAIFFSIKMFQTIKYKNINMIINQVASDFAFKGIYNKEKTKNLLNEFKYKYGNDNTEYNELVKMLDQYESFVTKIESILNKINVNPINSGKTSDVECSDNMLENLNDSNNSLKVLSLYDNQELSLKNTNCNLNNFECDFNNELSIIYKKRDGELKKIDRAIEFFDDDNYKSESKKAVKLDGSSKGNKKLTVYLYKKSADLQNNLM